MQDPSSQFVMSTELECLTSIPGRARSGDGWSERLFEQMTALAPTLPSTSGIFNGYGRIYTDCGHLELALAECDSPYLLALLVERQQELVRNAVTRLHAEGCPLLLANNNHSGLLQANCPTWGSHENYMTERHPSAFGDMILPFLTTRIFGGAGGIEYPYGHFVAAVRPIRMEFASGGGTTEDRAIHSTAREEHLMGERPGLYRYHVLLGDGHRSHYNVALQFGCSALALKSTFFDRKLSGDLRRIGAFPPKESWVSLLRRLNILASPGKPLRIDPLILRTQRVYLDAARRYADSLCELPDWIPGILRDWEHTLTAMERLDRPWLAARLDAFAKYEFFSAVLREMGETWETLPRHRALFNELTLLDHSYHEFCNPKSAFTRLERAGMLDHRVGQPIGPGQEPEPFVPETGTRARARARFIRENARRGGFVVDWPWVEDVENGRRRTIFDPFAQQYDEWEPSPSGGTRRGRSTRTARDLLFDAERAYARGEYEWAHILLRRIDRVAETLDHGCQIRYGRCQIWVQARRGLTDMDARLEHMYAGCPTNLIEVLDYCVAFRFRGLAPAPGMRRWIDHGLHLLSQPEHARQYPEAAAAFREHAGLTLLKEGRPAEARDMLQAAWEPPRPERLARRVQARILATLAETHRVLGNRRKARNLLRRAGQLQEQDGAQGDQADFTFTGLAKWARSRQSAISWIERAKQLQSHLHNQMGLVRSLLIESRVIQDAQAAAGNRAAVLGIRQQLPALAQCSLLAKVLDNWDLWVSGETPETEADDFWWV